jgi:DNA-binding transcriptional LysR family regulator
MELRQLAYVVAVAEEGSFTRAAQREHVAQPGVSAQVRRLEAELGQPLLHRGAAKVTLTAAGSAMLPFARAALAGAAGVRTAIDELTGLVRGHVAVGVVPSVGGRLADALAGFHADHPGVDITLVEDTSEALLDGVRSGRLDVAVAGLARPAPVGLATAIVTDEELVAAVGSDHRLAGRSTISVRGLADERLIALPRGTGGRSALESGFKAAGLLPHVALEAGDPRVLMDLASRGLGVAILPASAPEDLHVLHIRPQMRSRLELVWRADAPPSPAADALIARARQALAPYGDRGSALNTPARTRARGGTRPIPRA